MPLFGKNKGPEIPPVQDARNQLLGGRQPSAAAQQQMNTQFRQQQQPVDRAPSYRSVDPYAQQRPSQRQMPSQQNYDDQYQNSRAELFRNAPKPKDSFGNGDLDRPYDQYGAGRQSSGDQHQVQDEDEEVEAIKQQMRMTKQESLASTRNALRAAREAEETARNTLTKLGDQSERIGNTDRALDMTHAYNERSKDEAKEIQALNRSIFRPNITFNKSAKRDAEERRIVDRHQQEREQREENRRQVYESRERVEGAFKAAERSTMQSARDSKYQQAVDRYGGGKGGAASGAKLSGRAKYQFEADQEDDEIEQELDTNLNEIGDLSKRLNLLGRAMGEEVRTQNKKLDDMSTKTDLLDSRIYSATQRLQRIK